MKASAMYLRAAAMLAVTISAGAQAADAQPTRPADFGWHAAIELPAGASVARIDLPAAALVRLQSADARDLRVFNAAGEAVAFSFMGGPPAKGRVQLLTTPFAALPLYSAGEGRAARLTKGAMQVRVEDSQRSVWVQVDGQPAAGASRLGSVIVDTRSLKQSMGGVRVQATLPSNTPVRMDVSSSADLAHWTPIPVRGRLYRFEGEGAPARDTLAFEQDVRLEDRYLRLDWTGQDGVAVTSVQGIEAAAAPQPPRVVADLARPGADGTALEWNLPFATPLASLALTPAQPNTLLPVRLLGRNDKSQPWRVLSNTVLYRIGTGSAASVNLSLPLRGASVRWLRLESTTKADLSRVELEAKAEFDPLQVVFVASGSPPFHLAAGGNAIAPAALPIGVLAATLQGRKLQELPEARLGAASASPPPEPDNGLLARLLPAGMSQRAALLWAVLIAGVLLLGIAAWSLMRQLHAQPPAEP